MKFQDYKQVEKEYKMGGGWFDPQEGDNKIRLVSEFVPFGSHYDQIENKSYICVGKEKGCVGCVKGLNLSVKYLGWIIDRSDNEIKNYKMPHSVFKELGNYATNSEYSFDVLPPYDIYINKTGQKKETRYKVLPARENSELTDDEKNAIVDKIKEPEEIIQKMKDKVLKVEPDDVNKEFDEASTEEEM